MFRNLADGPRASGAARHRLDRRFRAFLKHDRLSLALQMATVHHLSRDKSDRKVDTAVQVNWVTDMTSSSTQTCVSSISALMPIIFS